MKNRIRVLIFAASLAVLLGFAAALPAHAQGRPPFSVEVINDATAPIPVVLPQGATVEVSQPISVEGEVSVDGSRVTVEPGVDPIPVVAGDEDGVVTRPTGRRTTYTCGGFVEAGETFMNIDCANATIPLPDSFVLDSVAVEVRCGTGARHLLFTAKAPGFSVNRIPLGEVDCGGRRDLIWSQRFGSASLTANVGSPNAGDVTVDVRMEPAASALTSVAVFLYGRVVPFGF